MPAISGSSGIVSGALDRRLSAQRRHFRGRERHRARRLPAIWRDRQGRCRIRPRFRPRSARLLRAQPDRSGRVSRAPNFTLADDAEYSTSQEIYGYAGLHANLLDDRFKNRVAFTLTDINRDNFDPTFGTAPSFIGRGRSERYEYQGDFKVIDQLRLVGGAEHEDSRFNDGIDFRLDRCHQLLWRGDRQPDPPTDADRRHSPRRLSHRSAATRRSAPTPRWSSIPARRSAPAMARASRRRRSISCSAISARGRSSPRPRAAMIWASRNRSSIAARPWA